MNFVSKPEEEKGNFDFIKQRSDGADNVTTELNFKTAVRGFQKQEVTEYIAELNRSFHASQEMLTRRVSELSDDVAVLKREKEKYREKAKSLKAELAAVKQDFLVDSAPETYKNIIKNLQDENQSLIEENKNLSTEYKASVSEAVVLREELSNVKSERDELAGAKKERDDAIEKLSKAETDSSMFGAQLNEMQKQNETLKSEVKNLSEGNGTLRKQIKEETEHSKKIETELSDAKEKLLQVTSEMNRVKEDFDQLKKENDSKPVIDVNEYTEKIDSLSSELEKFKNENQALQEQFDKASVMISESNKTESKLAKTEEKLKEAKNDIKSKTKEISELKGQLETALAGNEEAGEIENLKAENQKLKAELIEAQNKEPEKVIVTEKVSGEPVDVESAPQYLQLKEENQKLEESIVKYKQYFKQVKEELQAHPTVNSEDLQAANEKAEELKEKNTELRSKNKRLKEQIEQLSQQLELASASSVSSQTTDVELQVVKRERDHLLSEKVELESKIQAISFELENLRERKSAPSTSSNNVVVERLKELNGKLTRSNDRLQDEVEKLMDKNSLLIDKLNSAQDEIYRLQKDVEEEQAYKLEKENAKKGILSDSKIAKFDEEIDVNDIEKRLNKLLN